MDKLTQKELVAMIEKAYGRVEQKKEEINKINVFPVPDQDTGTNLAATLNGIYAAIHGRDFKTVAELGNAVLEGALTSAQGNAGVIFTGFLAGFIPTLDGKDVDAKTFTSAFADGAKRAHDSIQNPREGTMLDVINGAADSLAKEAGQDSDIASLLTKATKTAEVALLATREKMEVFKKANVVDAGGLGFLVILEGFLEAVGQKSERAVLTRAEAPSEEIKKEIQLINHRYEVAGLLEAGADASRFSEPSVKDALKGMGDFIDVVKVGGKMRVHVHTNHPKEAEAAIRQLGKVITMRVQDMSREVAGEEYVMPSAVGLVTEDIADLNQKIIERYHIAIAHTSITWPEGDNLPGENLYQRMRAADKQGIKTFPKTSQASPEQYLEAYKKQLAAYENVLCVTISSKLSGSYNSAKVAAGLAGAEKVTVFDSRQASAAQALVVLRAVEMVREGRSLEEIIKGLDLAAEAIKMYVFFDDPKWIEAGGRLTKNKAVWIRRLKKLWFHPLITVKDGVLVQDRIVFARDKVEALFKRVAKASASARNAGKKIRTVIAHADDEASAKALKKMLKEKINAEVSYIVLASPTLGAHAGPGSLIVAWTIIM